MELLLKKYFGYDKFRPMQLDIINNVLQKRDSLVLMPTGGGKSLCYQIPALKFDGLTIVISPLISLMKDQVDALKANGVDAEYINSTLSVDETKDIITRIEKKEIKILYITPERLALKSFRAFLSNITVTLIAIDEAHCICEWGHDFRKDYLGLKFLKDYFVGVPIIALTATATSKVKDEILKQLNLDNPEVFVSSFNRDNLNLTVASKTNSFAKILCLVEKNRNDSIIIYCHSRQDTEIMAKGLNKYGFRALEYHAGLSTRIRERNQELFINNKVNIIIATIAFGMGIDKSNVRVIIHDTFSKSIENYYQEIGRAGRDGLNSQCILFYSQDDIKKHEFFIDLLPNSTLRKSNNAKLNQMVSYCETKSCRRKYLLEYFGESFLKDNCGKCDICLKLIELN
ncbi:MAG: ATP-dependent DNA helicase [Candidatus Woesearchaeota archaeon]|jgi:ATP-dependent DNA helicase RecQ|nr:ATP-dependent DNA helicase [Candidatus Woesearchaeota archaeon]